MENVEENVNRPRDTEENVKETISKVSQSAHRAVDKMTDMGYQTTEVLGEKGEQLMSAEAEMVENYREYIRNYPMRSVGIAVAAGFFLSRLLR
ncbi:MAG: DUF883 family protein [Methylobacter sp.]|jgi:ElaB/YqjD/DUF883 family membrane-anchored ribosome-binding protein